MKAKKQNCLRFSEQLVRVFFYCKCSESFVVMLGLASRVTIVSASSGGIIEILKEKS